MDENTVKKLQALVDQIESIENEKAEIKAVERDHWLAVKSAGFDVKIVRQIIKMRQQDPSERAEQEAILETYKRALGMTPLEQHIADQEAA